jgi:hypothetical protein
MSATLIPDPRDASVDTATDTATVIDFNETPATALQPTTRRWWVIGGLLGGSIALATTATAVANVIVNRRAGSRQLFGVRPVRRYGLRHVATPRGGAAWVAYTYRLPDLRVRLPEMRLPSGNALKMAFPKLALPSARGHHR